MKINDLEFLLVELPTSHAARSLRSVLVRISTNSVLEGWGEAPVDWSSEELAARRDALLPLLSGRSIYEIEELLTLDALDNPLLAAAIEIACWDLIGKAAGQPVCHLSGGGFRQRIPLAARIPPASAEDATSVARELAEQGYHAQVISSNGAAEHDVQAASAVCLAAGGRFEVRLDGAAGYDLPTARRLCRDLEKLDLQLLIDPLGAEDPSAQASLRKETHLALGVARSIGSPQDVHQAARRDAASAAIVSLFAVGGMQRARDCASAADAAMLAMSLRAPPSTGVAVAAMLQLAASVPSLASANECSYHALQDDVLVEPLEVVDGMIAVPDAPGLGVEIDRAKLERYQIG